MPPSVMNVLAALHSAGDEGLTSGDIAEIYDPGRSHGTINAVNNILYRYRDNGKVRRSGEMEHLDCVTRTKVWRWYITPEGTRYYLQGGLAGQAAVRRAEKTAKRRSAQYHRDILAEATRQYQYGRGDIPHKERRFLIAELYAKGLNKREIATVVGLTRERVRQIIDGMTVTQTQRDQLLRLLRQYPEGLSTTQIKASGIDFPGAAQRSEGVLREACHYLADQGVIVAHVLHGQGAGGVKLRYAAPQEEHAEEPDLR